MLGSEMMDAREVGDAGWGFRDGALLAPTEVVRSTKSYQGHTVGVEAGVMVWGKRNILGGREGVPDEGVPGLVFSV